MTAPRHQIMKLALIQLNTLVGDINGNCRKIIRWISKAKAAGADVACFHELTLLGYPPRDLLELPYIIDRCRAALKEIAKAARGIAVVVGTVEPNELPVGNHLFNCAAWCEKGRIRTMVGKSLLPSYDVFDENRYFEPGRSGEVISLENHQFGLTICEDVWYQSGLRLGRIYSSDPVEKLSKTGADILLNISASPYSMGKFEERKELLCQLAKRYEQTIVYVNQVGGNDELIFDGGSMVVGPKGNVIAQAPFFKEGMIVVDVDHPEVAVAPQPERLSLLEEALVIGLRDYVQKCGFKKVALGLSGGIDSSLTAYLAARAVGPKNVLGLLMPSRFSSKGSLTDSRKLAKNLKIRTKEVPIKRIHKAYEQELKNLFGRRKPGIAEENVQARIRGNLLMAISNKLGHLVLTTGNKSELAVGYATLYGDMSGGLAVISDLPKTVVFELSQFINRRKEIIPDSVLTKPPSAELKPGQTDQDSLPPYDILDDILKAFVEENKSQEEIVSMGFQKNIVQDVLSRVTTNEYKRRQAPPGLRVTSKAFGMGRRFPIACKM